jgi:hypothetical protein
MSMVKTKAKALARNTKKARLLRLLQEHRGAVPLGLAARELYGRDDTLNRMRIVHLLGAYRQKDRRFAKIRIKGLHVRDERAAEGA